MTVEPVQQMVRSGTRRARDQPVVMTPTLVTLPPKITPQPPPSLRRLIQLKPTDKNSNLTGESLQKTGGLSLTSLCACFVFHII